MIISKAMPLCQKLRQQNVKGESAPAFTVKYATEMQAGKGFP